MSSLPLILFLKRLHAGKECVNVTVPTKTISTGKLDVTLHKFADVQDVARHLVEGGNGGHHRTLVQIIVGEKNDGETDTTDAVAVIGDFVNR